jgi:Tfp pilus assembly protein PilF
VLYPDAEEPKKQLQKIETQLVEVTKQAEIDERYNKLIRIGDSALKAGDFHLSLKNFQQALDMKPEKAYPLKQIKAAESGIQNRLRTAKEPEANKMRQP